MERPGPIRRGDDMQRPARATERTAPGRSTGWLPPPLVAGARFECPGFARRPGAGPWADQLETVRHWSSALAPKTGQAQLRSTHKLRVANLRAKISFSLHRVDALTVIERLFASQD